MTVSGTHFNYFMVCQRKLWLLAHGITMEQESELVHEGKLIHENSYPQRNPNCEEIAVDGLLAGRVLLAQAKAYQNKRRRVALATKFIDGAACNMLQNLNYYNRRGKSMTEPTMQIKQLAASLAQSTEINELMGIEGNIRKTYYACFDTILDGFAMGERMNETFHHRSLDRNVSYRHLIKLECYKLVKDIMGIAEYKPFKMYW